LPDEISYDEVMTAGGPLLYRNNMLQPLKNLHFHAEITNTFFVWSLKTRISEESTKHIRAQNMFMFQLYDTALVNFYKQSNSLLKHSWILYVHPGLTFKNSTFFPNRAVVCLYVLSEQTAIISPTQT
jgi:hypothetical protein